MERKATILVLVLKIKLEKMRRQKAKFEGIDVFDKMPIESNVASSYPNESNFFSCHFLTKTFNETRVNGEGGTVDRFTEMKNVGWTTRSGESSKGVKKCSRNRFSKSGRRFFHAKIALKPHLNLYLFKATKRILNLYLFIATKRIKSDN
jgi:hypothetical protein